MTARLAQSVERKALNLVVVGSSPSVGVLSLSTASDYLDFNTCDITSPATSATSECPAQIKFPFSLSLPLKRPYIYQIFFDLSGRELPDSFRMRDLRFHRVSSMALFSNLTPYQISRCSDARPYLPDCVHAELEHKALIEVDSGDVRSAPSRCVT